jgi:demethylmenaquinone methyltransferase/2-methoxy-6-polyprenyl-1,4-benzoquinol methylase
MPAVADNETPPTVDKSGEKVRAMFGEIAPKYDRMNHLLSMNVDRYWRWRTVRKVSPLMESASSQSSQSSQSSLAGLPILDVCTGTGDLAIAYSNRARQKLNVIGADFCPEMLEIARTKQQRKAIPSDRLSFVEADAQQLPFDDDRFQIVSVAFGLRNVADTLQGLREMTRVCAPGGRVAVLEFSMPRAPVIKQGYAWYFKHVLPKIGRLFASNSKDAYQYLPDTVGEFPAYQQLADLMLAAGLSRAAFFPLNFGIATLYVGTK